MVDPTGEMGHCYICDICEAQYEAHLDWDSTPIVRLCEHCARWERNAGSVVWIRARLTGTPRSADYDSRMQRRAPIPAPLGA